VSSIVILFEEIALTPGRASLCSREFSRGCLACFQTAPVASGSIAARPKCRGRAGHLVAERCPPLVTSESATSSPTDNEDTYAEIYRTRRSRGRALRGRAAGRGARDGEREPRERPALPKERASERRPPGGEACSRAPLFRFRVSEGRKRVRFARGPTTERSHRDCEPRYPGSEGRKRVRFARGPTRHRRNRESSRKKWLFCFRKDPRGLPAVELASALGSGLDGGLWGRTSAPSLK
jgi:hypothetical protein